MEHAYVVVIGLAVLMMVTVACQAAPPATAPSPDNYRALADEVDQHLRKHVLDAWYPRAVDERGGFFAVFNRDWSRGSSQGEFIVFEARLAWTAAEVAKRRRELRDEYNTYALHGLEHLLNVMWDKEHGGFFWMLDDDGTPSENGWKHLYGQDFGIYAAANVYAATKDPRALDLAQRAYRWLEEHAHDDVNGGYLEHYNRDGSLTQPAPDAFDPAMRITPIGYKSMNAHIHVLEALTALYTVWPDPQLRRRLEELHTIVRDKVVVEPGALQYWLTNDWRGVQDHDSYGHDIETAYLLAESAHALGIQDDEKTQWAMRLLVDHTLAVGWDEEHGGVYEKGPAMGEPYDKGKSWWPQFEALNALLLMHELHGHETTKYWTAFLQQWRQIQRDMTDTEFGGHYGLIDHEGKIDDRKGYNWKACYHDGRALLEVSDRLRRMSEGQGHE